MRTLFGALVGALLGGAITAGLTSAYNVQAYWPVVLAGLVAGVAMRKLASNDHVSYLRGALAALATVLAMIGGPLVGAKLISQQKPTISKVETTAAAVEDATAKDSDEGGEVVEQEPPPTPILSQAKGSIGKQSDINPLDAILMAVGCLLAYQIGKGSELATVAAPEERATDSDDDSGADGGEKLGEKATQEA